ncbi:flagellar biosynthesis protein FlhB [Paenibacillus psychroresistens]|uniref:Flagellar biosynthetic protein FlhB n=1 Tax=Paenibacillus psychroresistens TaxID=1778678 RepID=A0A6B8RL55_9BACL|nr:flagellar biosynthesis protein FlhB [Paenibacillus psychroresistens]QGQ96245.1 flagellar biosynthesis protein FlhB [Paenibacillus psychroresistens]
MPKFRLQLDLQLFSQEKTESATPKKRQEARKKGQVAKSSELPGAFILLFTFLSFMMFGAFLKKHFFNIFNLTFSDYLLSDITIPNVVTLFGKLMIEGLILLTPIFFVTMLLALMGNYLQIGLLFTGDPLLMKFSKINPLEGAKKIFGLRSIVEFLKSMLKVTVVGVVVYITLSGQINQIMKLSHISLENTLSFVASITIRLGITIGAILVVLALFDYIYQKYEHEKSLKMSKQDIKDEYKKSEGDPLIKGKIKERQRKLAMQRMMQEIPNADVIITNPTHYAIALKYNATAMEAPKVIAKGKDYLALKIREIAKSNNIVMMENKPLARALYDQVELGESIPADLFQAVAEVLAYVYKIKGKSS